MNVNPAFSYFPFIQAISSLIPQITDTMRTGMPTTNYEEGQTIIQKVLPGVIAENSKDDQRHLVQQWYLTGNTPYVY